ncbi:MAG: SWIM zinc finger family protein, partial [Verrucomicrobia bacterium]|nr:SWIM zinc finger family protein [Verrucomicrobiota bacterium]
MNGVAWCIPGQVLEAKVQGSKLYTTMLTFDEDRVFTECTCEYGDDCKHGAALILELRKHALEVKAPKVSAEAASMAQATALDSLAGFVSTKLGRPLTKMIVGFLNRAENLWKSDRRVIEQSVLHELCGRQRYWGYGQIDLYPAELKPTSPDEYLVFLSIALQKSQLPLPAPLDEVIDPKLQKEIKAKWQRLKEIAQWRSSLAQWQEMTVSDALEAPVLRLILLPTAAVVQVRHPGESEFGKVTQKLLKEFG